MTFDIAAVLLQDGIANGAVYILLATILVLVFTVTRIVLVPQGDFVAFSALTMAALEAGIVPGVVWVVTFGATLAFALDLHAATRAREFGQLRRSLAWFGAGPVLFVGMAVLAADKEAPLAAKLVATCGLITCLGPILYRVAFQPIASASPLILLIAAVAAHFGLNSLGLHFFGAEGVRTTGFSGTPLSFGGWSVTRQAAGVVLTSLLFVGALFLFFRRTLRGKALLAAAYNRRGAELVGISTDLAGRSAFLIAGFVGAVSGILIGPMTTLYYDSGFILGLKGFVAAIVGGLAIYPLAAAGALLVGVIEAFASFWASAYRDVLVFTLIIPVLFWRSVASPVVEEDA